MNELKFLAIDSSLSATGIAVGTIGESIKVESIDLHETAMDKSKKVRASSDTIRRCRETSEFVQSWIANWQPQVIFAETPSGSQSASGMKSYGATCQLIAVLLPVPIEVTPMEAKMVVSKNASKRKIIDWAFEKYGDLEWLWDNGKLQAKNEHMADAIAIAHAGVQTVQFKQLIALL